MARQRTRLALAAFLVALSLPAPPAGAQALMRLHVRSLTLNADPQRLRVGDTLRVVMRAHVDERVARLDNVTLPDLSGFDVLGDERRCVPARRGTDCTETLGLSPTVPGTRTIAPVALDVVDARTGRPSRFASNAVTVTVLAAPTQAPQMRAVETGLREALRTALIVALVGVALLALWWAFARVPRRARVPVPPAPSAPVAPPAPPDEAARLRELIAALRAEPARVRVMAVRTALRQRLAARENETLADLLARDPARDDPELAAALVGVERAAFVEDADVSGSVEAALPALEAIA